MFFNIRQPNSDRRQTSGVALVVTLTMLAIVALLAIAFVMTARTELKSGSAYNDQVVAKSLAKMAVDRALMEIVRQGASTIVSGQNLMTNSSATAVYSCSDLTQCDNYTNDTLTVCITGTTTNGGDYVNLAQLSAHSANDPYWISVKDGNGKLVGRFAYLAYGFPVDINAIGNIAGSGDTYQRPADPNFGAGYLGQSWTATAPNYTRGICADVSLQKFLEKLGYGGAGSTYTPAQAAQRILQFRYGWDPSTAPTIGAYIPGFNPPQPASDNNHDNVNNNPSEYIASGSGDDQAIGSLSQLDAAPNPIAPDPGNTNLAAYATTSSADPNLTNSVGFARVNLNAMQSVSDVPTLVAMLTAAQITTNREQIAVNLIDFHTSSRYPTVYTNNGNTYIGIKPTPYLNQVLLTNQVVTKIVTNAPGSSPTNYVVDVFVNTCSEIWNPYGTFPDTCMVVVASTVSMIASNGQLSLNFPIIATNYFGSGLANFTPSTVSAGLTNGYYVATNVIAVAQNIIWSTNSTLPASILLTQTVNSVSFYGLTNGIGGIPMLINQVQPTNIAALTYGWVGVVAGQYPKTNYNGVTGVFNLEADDPRMNKLYKPTTAAANNSLGVANTTTWSPNAPNTNAWAAFPDTGCREGLASYYVKTNAYISIGEIGYVHRGEPWATLRLQPTWAFSQCAPTPPQASDSQLLEFIRVNDFNDVAGRINVNSDVNGPLGSHQSPAFFALFSGLSNSVYGTITDAKITSIIAEIDAYRSTLPGGMMGSIGKICEITNLVTDLSGNLISSTNDAAREEIIRDVANLISARGGGAAQIIGWGQIIKGGTTTSGVPGVTVIIKATYTNVGGRIALSSFQYYSQ